MKEATIKAYAKINLSIDVLGKRADGYHLVRMIMQQIDLWDLVRVRLKEEPAKAGEIGLSCRVSVLSQNAADLPCDESNLAWKAAALLFQARPESKARLEQKGTMVDIHIEKNIPMAAGLAGGSADAAAVLHALNRLLELGLSLQELMELGVKLGADVPFCIMGQAAAEKAPVAQHQAGQAAASAPLEECGPSTCAEATGIGEILVPLPPLGSWVLLSKPPIAVSTAEVYGALDGAVIEKRPGTESIIECLKKENCFNLYENMYNVLEKVSEFLYPVIANTRESMEWGGVQTLNASKPMMSGSGPTVFMLASERAALAPLFEKMKAINPETYLIETLR